MAKAWHYAWQGKSEGPVEEQALEDLIRAGRVRADTLIWAEGMANWEPAAKHFGFAPAQPFAPVPPAPPPMPGHAGGAQPYAAAPARSFTEAVAVCFQKYATFRGRASRSEYWWFTLFVTLLGLLGALLEGAMGSDGQALSGIISLATFLPSLSVTVRRLHDTDRSGWWIGAFWLGIIPFAIVLAFFGASIEATGTGGGAGMAIMALIVSLAALAYTIAMFVFMVQRGTPGPNRFG